MRGIPSENSVPSQTRSGSLPGAFREEMNPAQLLQADPSHIPAEAIPALLGELERLRAELWARLMRPPADGQGSSGAADPLAGLRCLSPRAVAELLGLKDSYVHELCRTGTLPAIKQGKYWLIPVEGLQQWKAARQNHLDKHSSDPLRSGRDIRRASSHPKAPGAVAITIRRASRRSSGDDEKVGSGHARHVQHSGPADPPAR